MTKITIFSDGGARGNPGHAGIGFAIYKNNVSVAREGEYVGLRTNNSAEYLAILKALDYIFHHKIEGEEIECFLDSQLVVRQLMGQYKVKKPHLKNYFIQIRNLVSKIKEGTCKKILFTHIPRDQNKEADGLVNEAVDLYLNNLGSSR